MIFRKNLLAIAVVIAVLAILGVFVSGFRIDSSQPVSSGPASPSVSLSPDSTIEANITTKQRTSRFSVSRLKLGMTLEETKTSLGKATHLEWILKPQPHCAVSTGDPTGTPWAEVDESLGITACGGQTLEIKGKVKLRSGISRESVESELGTPDTVNFDTIEFSRLVYRRDEIYVCAIIPIRNERTQRLPTVKYGVVEQFQLSSEPFWKNGKPY